MYADFRDDGVVFTSMEIAFDSKNGQVDHDAEAKKDEYCKSTF